MMEELKELLEKGLINEGIHAGLSARVKEVESIDKSLRRRDDHLAKDKGKRFESLDDVLRHIHDLAGLRIVVPFRDQLTKAKEFIERTFSQQGEPTHFLPDREVGQKWKKFEFGAYETLNYRLSYRTGQYRDVTFEVQLTGLAEHLFNMVNHPFLYKGAYGPLTEADEMVLDQLHGHAKGFTLSIQQLVKDRLRPPPQVQGIQQVDGDAMVAMTRNLLSRVIQESDTIVNHVVKGVEGGKTPARIGDQGGPMEQLSKLFDRIQIAVDEAKCPRYHNIPFPRNEALVKRGGIFSELERLLPSQAESQTAALWGLGGSGKTQVALEYAYRRWHNSAPCSVFWVHADNEATFTQDYQSIAKKLRLPANLQDEELLAAVRDRIEAEPSWVLVLDNADNLGLFGAGWRTPGASGQPHRTTTDYAPKNLRQFVPRGPTGTVLWTTRDERIAGSLVIARQTINVARMEAGEAVKLLETMRNQAINDTEQDNASALLAELDWLPLAISQAAAYMRRTRTPIEEYLSKLKGGKRRWRILRASEPDVHRRCEVSNSILKTWSISIEHIRQENEMAYNILHILAFLDNQNIPEQMMKKAAKHFESRRAQSNAITRLREFSFLSLRASDWGRAYEMHKLVQEAARYRLRAKEDETFFAKAALRIADDLFPERRRELWEEGEKYLVHAQRVGEWAELCGEEEAAALLTRVSGYLYDRGRWREKEPVSKKTYGLRKKVLGDKHPDTIWSMADLATTYRIQGRYDEAEKMNMEALALRRDVLGDKHPDTIWSMATLATIYGNQGRYDEAEKMNMEALALRRDMLGDKHPDTIRSVASLATTYRIQGSIASLATTYHNQKKYDEAEKMQVEVLALQRDVLGDKHPHTIQSMYGLAFTWNSLGRPDLLAPGFNAVLARRSRRLITNRLPYAPGRCDHTPARRRALVLPHGPRYQARTTDAIDITGTRRAPFESDPDLTAVTVRQVQAPTRSSQKDEKVKADALTQLEAYQPSRYCETGCAALGDEASRSLWISATAAGVSADQCVCARPVKYHSSCSGAAGQKSSEAHSPVALMRTATRRRLLRLVLRLSSSLSAFASTASRKSVYAVPYGFGAKAAAWNHCRHAALSSTLVA
ncbi:hypothetical protein, variant [Gaeumannomyces tritici R3-111a-1]|uniref:RelA/SpoT domain-containing protein n=1 Tax=Gaeumannomyces tritici (strain R3-111a-1) TaxID=644352 RepID=J3PJC1_GAET3|nr:hypothetical protein, variant [Gaeumannomyces tritici R3-111a-1]EJT68821.1 hypothetical protein, variant [Gaeumannomyces tritici R3-111a-1]